MPKQLQKGVIDMPKIEMVDLMVQKNIDVMKTIIPVVLGTLMENSLDYTT